jgi:hypothetical protein
MEFPLTLTASSRLRGGVRALRTSTPDILGNSPHKESLNQLFKADTVRTTAAICVKQFHLYFDKNLISDLVPVTQYNCNCILIGL